MLGVVTNQSFLNQLLNDPVFVAGEATTNYIDAHVLDRAKHAAQLGDVDVALAAVLLLREIDPQPDHFRHWSNTEALARKRSIVVNDAQYAVRVIATGGAYTVQIAATTVRLVVRDTDGATLRVRVAGVERSHPYAFDGERLYLAIGDRQLMAHDVTYRPASSASGAGSGKIAASTDGLLVLVAVARGEAVVRGQLVAVVEAMKMEHRHLADGDGVVEEIRLAANTQVKKGQLLVSLALTRSESGEVA